MEPRRMLGGLCSSPIPTGDDVINSGGGAISWETRLGVSWRCAHMPRFGRSPRSGSDEAGDVLASFALGMLRVEAVPGKAAASSGNATVASHPTGRD